MPTKDLQNNQQGIDMNNLGSKAQGLAGKTPENLSDTQKFVVIMNALASIDSRLERMEQIMEKGHTELWNLLELEIFIVNAQHETDPEKRQQIIDSMLTKFALSPGKKAQEKK